MSQYLLFYGKSCKMSIKFINLLTKVNARGYFNFIDAAKDPRTGQRNRYVQQFGITNVPTIIINDRKYVGKEVFYWLRSIVYEMGLSGPTSVDSRQNKDSSQINPREYDNGYEEDEAEGPMGYQGDEDNYTPVGTSNEGINYIPEDGQTRRPTNDINMMYDTILPADEARELDIKLLKSGGKTGNGRDNKRKTGLKGDQLKEKQYNNEFERYKKERESEVAQPRRRF